MGERRPVAITALSGFNVCTVLQAWIEASTKGAVLIFAASEIEERAMKSGVSPAAAGLLGGMGGGIAQAYATMGMWSVLVSFSALF